MQEAPANPAKLALLGKPIPPIRYFPARRAMPPPLILAMEDLAVLLIPAKIRLNAPPAQLATISMARNALYASVILRFRRLANLATRGSPPNATNAMTLYSSSTEAARHAAYKDAANAKWWTISSPARLARTPIIKRLTPKTSAPVRYVAVEARIPSYAIRTIRRNKLM